MNAARVNDSTTIQRIEELIRSVGGDPAAYEGRLILEAVQTCLKLVPDGHDTGQVKLINRALKEMRYAYRVFNQYRGIRKISIFGSARTPEDHRDYQTAKRFSAAIADRNWMSITGAGDGIMKAGHEGPRRNASFGLSIRLPFETTANTVIEGDAKLINFRYFFTRKLMFLSHSDAVAVFPGGFGTQDELFEALTLVQTGKSNIIPIVLLEGQGGEYWAHWKDYIQSQLLANGWIGPDDPNLVHHAASVEDAVEHVVNFYRVFHSSRYVGEKLVLRLQQQPSDALLAKLNEEFTDLLATGRFEATTAQPPESDHLTLPRIAFHHNRRQYARLRQLIDCINRGG